MCEPRDTCNVHIFMTILLCQSIGCIRLLSVLVVEHPSICICHIVSKMNVNTPLTLQIVGTVRKHDVIYQQDNAKPYKASVT